MKTFVLTGIKKMELVDTPKPVITNDDDVLIKMKRVGVCGSDIHYYETGKIGSQVVAYPFPVGHEGAGVVESIGPAVKKLKPGDEIAIEPAMPCFECDQCLTGRHHTCRNLRFLGCPGQADGCLSEFIVMPETSCFKLENGLNLDDGALSEPLAIGVYAVKLAGIQMKGLKIGILGFGPIGMSTFLPAQAGGADKIYVTDKIPERLALAKKLGAAWTGNPDIDDVEGAVSEQEPLLLDVVFECCGQQDAIDNAIEMLKPGGKLMIIGIPEVDRISFQIDKMRRKEISIQNVRRQNEAVELTLEMMGNKTVDAHPMITHRFKFDDTVKAFDLVASYSDGVMKAMIDYD
ncbi:alcohol dehydrogenase catalytic domain-containing protein [Bacteroidota bacterium]